MSPLTTLWQVAARELREQGRSRTYLITTVITVLIVVGLIVVPGLFAGGSDEYEIGVVGEGNQEIIDASVALVNVDDEPGDEPSVVMNAVPFDDQAEAEAALENAEVDAVLVDGSEVILESVGGFGESTIADLLQRGAATVRLEEIVATEGQAAEDLIELMTSDPLETTTLTGQESGDDTAGVVAYAGLLLLYIAVLMYGTWILSGVTEEKSNRVVEVLLSSVRPWQLLGGKIAGIGILGIAQFAGTILVAVVALNLTGSLEVPPIAPVTIFNLVLWFVLGFLLFAVMFGAAGSLVSRTEDAQNVAFPMSLTAVVGFFVSISALNDPAGVTATIGTFVPLTAPFVVPVRAALDAIPAWQYVASVLLTVATIIGMTFVAGRIYAGALLRYGGRTKLREAWRAEM